MYLSFPFNVCVCVCVHDQDSFCLSSLCWVQCYVLRNRSCGAGFPERIRIHLAYLYGLSNTFCWFIGEVSYTLRCSSCVSGPSNLLRQTRVLPWISWEALTVKMVQWEGPLQNLSLREREQQGNQLRTLDLVSETTLSCSTRQETVRLFVLVNARPAW